jgi:hypothetical protein
VSDFNFKLIEYINSGVTFQSTANGFDLASFKADSTVINSVNVNYTFTLIPKNSFQAEAALKLYFPPQL